MSMKKIVFAVLCGMAISAAFGGVSRSLAMPLAAEQNGSQKKRYVITVDGTNCWTKAVRSECAPSKCSPVPAMPPAGATLSPVGDQHLVLKDAAGKPLFYYHLVTDRWVDAGKMAFKKGFGPVAWSVLAAYFLLMAGMAWYFIRKKKTAADYFIGGGKIPWYVAGMSIFATMLSSISFLAVPAQFYIADWRYVPMTFGIFAMAPVVIFFYLPFFRRLKVASAYEYLERRFNAAVRLFASGAYVVFMVSRVAIVTLLPALALNAMTGVSIDGCILVCGVATIIYCAFGGFEAVVWSDFVQGIVLVSGALAIFVALVHGSDGGIAGAWADASANGKTTLLDLRFLSTEPVLWVVLVIAVIENLSSYTSDQCVIQRYMSVKDEKAAARSIWFNGVFTVVVSTMFSAIGTALWTYYRSHPEMLDPSLPKADSILPFFIVSGLPPALAGLVAAALFAATISTLSANLSSAATAARPPTRRMNTPRKKSPASPAVSTEMNSLNLSKSERVSVCASTNAAAMPRMPAANVKIRPQRICASEVVDGRNLRTKSAVSAVAALERFAESVEMVAAKSAAATSPASAGGSPETMKYGRMLSAFGSDGSSISGCER